MNKLRVVLDTNVLLISIPKKSKYRPLFDSLVQGKIEIVISNEILNEYVEIIEQKANSVVAQNIAQMLVRLQNVEKIEVSFR